MSVSSLLRDGIAPWLTVLTTPARQQYLKATVANLDHHGGGAYWLGHKIVCVDGDVTKVPSFPGWAQMPVGGIGRPNGTRRALWRILHLAARAKAPYLLYFEDDVLTAQNAVVAMGLLTVQPGCAFYVFCNQKKGLPTLPGIHCKRADDPLNAPGHWGTQAMKIPFRSLQRFADPATEPLNQYPFSSDLWLGDQLATSKSPEHYYGIVLPSLVRHVGAQTTIEAQIMEPFSGHRLGLNYAGDDFDAMSLLDPLGAR